MVCRDVPVTHHGVRHWKEVVQVSLHGSQNSRFPRIDSLSSFFFPTRCVCVSKVLCCEIFPVIELMDFYKIPWGISRTPYLCVLRVPLQVN